MKYAAGFFILLFSQISNAYLLQKDSSYIHYAVTQNINPLGNIRYGTGTAEYGYLQGDQIGVMFVRRTRSSPIFIQAGFGIANGAAFIVGGGLESEGNSWFRWRSDITLSLDKNIDSELVVTVGGIFIL